MMEPKAFRALMMLICSCILPTESLVCNDCTGIADITTCNTTKHCGQDESCFMDRITTGNTALFTLGCISNKQCNINPGSGTAIIGRSLTAQQDQRCHECCSTDHCSAQLCSHHAPTECMDDDTVDCSYLNTLVNICSDESKAMTLCPHFCGICVVNGKWSSWSVWTSCSVTCENGTQSRSRTCNNPSPAHGGEGCHGNNTEIQQCMHGLCPVHGGWSTWSSRGQCSVTCGVGMQRRHRDCTNPPPSTHGNDCYGDSLGYTLCYPGACADGEWSGWNEWSNCSVVNMCAGFKTRYRTCSNPPPSSFGQNCVGNSTQISSCFRPDCPINGDCFEIKKASPTAKSGVYNMHLTKSNTGIKVYCDMTTDGGGWTVFQRRVNGTVDFFRTFAEYENGFGDINGEFWLGLKYIQELASIGRSELRIDLAAADGSEAYEIFQNFYLSPGRAYTLHIGAGTGTAGDDRNGLAYHNGYNFATKDNDSNNRCGQSAHGGWWYNDCANVNLNGFYEVPGTTSSYLGGQGGVIYYDFKQRQSLRSTSMMLRRNI